MEIMEKVAYLKGLTEGLGLDQNTKEGKVLTVVIDLLDDIALAISEMSESVVIMSEELETVEESLEEVLEDLYGDDEDSCDCGGRDCDFDFDGELYEVACPSCMDTVYVDEDMLDEGEINCPGCGETLEFDLDGVLAVEELGDDSKQ